MVRQLGADGCRVKIKNTRLLSSDTPQHDDPSTPNWLSLCHVARCAPLHRPTKLYWIGASLEAEGSTFNSGTGTFHKLEQL
jgi:hypothetical protein